MPAFDTLATGIVPPTPEFVLAIAADTTHVEDPRLFAVCTALLRSGAGYACCWGPGCKRLHDMFDQASASLGVRADSVVMTTWDDDEPWEETLWFATNAAFPHPGYEAAFASVVVVTVAEETWFRQACSYLELGAPMRDEA